MPSLFDPIRIGEIECQNRIFMAPCTRNRATPDETPTSLMAQYYGQRSGAGLIISEGVNPEPRGRGYYRVPGAYAERHREGWRQVGRSVAQGGGHMFAQIMHCGRLSFPELQPENGLPIAPSAIAPDPNYRGMSYGCPKPDVAFTVPRTLEADEIPKLVESFAAASRLLVDAGLDGVELHGASGYLPMQFLTSNTNRRTDRYGGSIERRSRFLLEVVEAMCGAVGAGRVAVKLTPAFRFHDVHDEDPVALYRHVSRMLSGRGLAFVEVADFGDYYSFPNIDPIGLVRENFDGTLVANGGLDAARGQELLNAGKADAISYGTGFIANPDLPKRFRNSFRLNALDTSTFYLGEEKGYTDYPFAGEGMEVETAAQTSPLSVDFDRYQNRPG